MRKRPLQKTPFSCAFAMKDEKGQQRRSEVIAKKEGGRSQAATPCSMRLLKPAAPKGPRKGVEQLTGLRETVRTRRRPSRGVRPAQGLERYARVPGGRTRPLDLVWRPSGRLQWRRGGVAFRLAEAVFMRDLMRPSLTAHGKHVFQAYLRCPALCNAWPSFSRTWGMFGFSARALRRGAIAFSKSPSSMSAIPRLVTIAASLGSS